MKSTLSSRTFDVHLQLYRISQESIQNVVKHSRALVASVTRPRKAFQSRPGGVTLKTAGISRMSSVPDIVRELGIAPGRV